MSGPEETLASIRPRRLEGVREKRSFAPDEANVGPFTRMILFLHREHGLSPDSIGRVLHVDGRWVEAVLKEQGA